MWKTLLAGTAAIAIAGTSIVYAQQPRRGDDNNRWRPSQEDRAAFTDARIAALKAGLRLTPEQEKNWAAFEAALRDISKARAERALARRNNEPRPADPVERLRRQAEMLSTAGAALKRLADAQEPLYKSLDESQKHRFQALSRLLGPRHPRFAGMGGRGGRDMMRRHHEEHHGPADGGRRGGHGGGAGERL